MVPFPFLNLPGGIVFGGRVGAGGLFSKRKYKKQYFFTPLVWLLPVFKLGVTRARIGLVVLQVASYSSLVFHVPIS